MALHVLHKMPSESLWTLKMGKDDRCFNCSLCQEVEPLFQSAVSLAPRQLQRWTSGIEVMTSPCGKYSYDLIRWV